MEIDDISEGPRTVAAWQLVNAAPEESREILDAVVQSRPQFALAHYIRGRCLIALDQVDAAVQSYESAVRLSSDQTFYLAGEAFAYAKAGRRDEAWRKIERLEDPAELGAVSTLDLANACLELGDKERFYQILERSLVERGGNPWLLTSIPEGIKSEPRFIDLVNRTGLLRYNPDTQEFEANDRPPLGGTSKP